MAEKELVAAKLEAHFLDLMEAAPPELTWLPEELESEPDQAESPSSSLSAYYEQYCELVKGQEDRQEQRKKLGLKALEKAPKMEGSALMREMLQLASPSKNKESAEELIRFGVR